MENEEFKAKRKQSLQRVHQRWQDIIDKYSNLDEEEQGDLLDLSTGDIIEDAGHLRSLQDSMQQKENVWKSLLYAEANDNRAEAADRDKVNKVLFETDREGSTPIESSDEEDYDGLLRDNPDLFDAIRNRKVQTRSKVKDNLSVVRKTPSEAQIHRRVLRTDEQIPGVANDPLALVADTQEEDLTPGKVRRFREGLVRSEACVGNTKLKRMVYEARKKSPRSPRSPSPKTPKRAAPTASTKISPIRPLDSPLVFSPSTTPIHAPESPASKTLESPLLLSPSLRSPQSARHHRTSPLASLSSPRRHTSLDPCNLSPTSTRHCSIIIPID